MRLDLLFLRSGLLILALANPVVGAARESTDLQRSAENHYETRAPSHDGIGKIYFGREIAQVMGHQGAEWLERPEREEEERTDLLMETLQIKPGEYVADVGAGSGYFSWRIAQKVGPSGRVYAEDIQQEFLDLMMANMKKRGVENIVHPVLGTTQSPALPKETLDTVLLVDVYHELDFPFEMAEGMIEALKPGGRLVLVEYRGEDPAVPIKPLHKMTVTQVRKEFAGHPISFEDSIESLPRQHVIVFRKSGGSPSKSN